jgi:hypothetical protein
MCSECRDEVSHNEAAAQIGKSVKAQTTQLASAFVPAYSLGGLKLRPISRGLGKHGDSARRCRSARSAVRTIVSVALRGTKSIVLSTVHEAERVVFVDARRADA